MTTPRVHGEARQELREAIDWYEARNPGLGVQYLGAADLAIRAIGEEPERYPVWIENPRFRRHALDRFPYVIFFRMVANGVEVVAIAHASREPGYRMHRVGP